MPGFNDPAVTCYWSSLWGLPNDSCRVCSRHRCRCGLSAIRPPDASPCLPRTPQTTWPIARKLVCRDRHIGETIYCVGCRNAASFRPKRDTLASGSSSCWRIYGECFGGPFLFVPNRIRYKPCMLSILKKRPARPVGQKERWTLLDIDGQTVDVRIVENPRTTRLTLRLVPASNTGEPLKVPAPPHSPEADVDAFLERNRNWAAARLSRLPKVVRIENGAMIPVHGQMHEIVHSGRKRGVVSIGLEETGPVIRVHGDPKFTGRRVADFLKRQAKQELTVSVPKGSPASSSNWTVDPGSHTDASTSVTGKTIGIVQAQRVPSLSMD